MLRPSWNIVEIMSYQRWNNVERTIYNLEKPAGSRLYNVVSTSDTDVVSTLHNVENSTSDFVTFSKSNQCYFNLDAQRWNEVAMMLKCLGGLQMVRAWTTLEVIPLSADFKNVVNSC